MAKTASSAGALAADVRELGNRPAGIGRLTASLLRAVAAIDPSLRCTLLGEKGQGRPDLPGEFRSLATKGFLWHAECAALLGASPGWNNYLSIKSPIVPALVPGKSILFINDMICRKYSHFFKTKVVLIDRVFTRLAIRRVGRIAAISRSTADDIRSFNPECRVRVIPLAADPVFGPAVPDKRHLERLGLGKSFILTVGTIEPRKNHLRLMEAYMGLPASLREKHLLAIAGKKGWKCEREIERMRELNPAGVRFLGYLPDQELLHLYNAATVFIYPSLYEGFGLPVVEAMKCGLPVVTSSTSSLPEVGGEAVLYADPGSIESIKGSLEIVLSDPKLRTELSRKGLAWASMFSWENTARRMMEMMV